MQRASQRARNAFHAKIDNLLINLNQLRINTNCANVGKRERFIMVQRNEWPGCKMYNFVSKFAKHARGIVRVMLNGSRVSPEGEHIPAYKRDR